MRRIMYFASKDAMDIEHMGEKVVEQLFTKKLVQNFSDIYTLTEHDLAKLEGFKEKSIQNLLESIDESRHVTLERFILRSASNMWEKARQRSSPNTPATLKNFLR